MRAVTCRNGELDVVEVTTPVPAAGELLIRVIRAGICGSDLHSRTHCDQSADTVAEMGYDAFMRSSQTVIMGHEFVGEVVSYGPDCREKWSIGTPVVAVPMLKNGGHAHLIGLSERAPGAYAEYMLLAEDLTMPVPGQLSTDLAALTEPMSVAYHAVRRGEVDRRDVAVVIGCGPIGLGVILMLKASGVRSVVASDMSEGRRELALGCGADVVVDPTHDSPWQACTERRRYLTSAADLFGLAFAAARRLNRDSGVRRKVVADRPSATLRGPVVFECVGVPGVIDGIVSHAPFRTRVVVVGVCMEPDTFRPAIPVNKEIDLRFVSAYGPDEFRDTLQMIADGSVDPSPLVTATVGLDGVATAFDALASAEHHAKVLIDPASTVDTL
ncbi:zinc-binding dehydrogenase [Gordonia sp. NPDC003424]